MSNLDKLVKAFEGLKVFQQDAALPSLKWVESQNDKIMVEFHRPKTL